MEQISPGSSFQSLAALKAKSLSLLVLSLEETEAHGPRISNHAKFHKGLKDLKT